MGMWSSPFSSEKKAEKLKELMSKPWVIVVVDGRKTLPEAYDLIGEDQLFDLIQEYSPGDDMRPVVKSALKRWLEEIESFFKVDPDALKIIKKLSKSKEY